MRLPEEPDQPFQINIVPMIDVIFAILTFFIMSSLFLTRSTGLPVDLPKAGTAQPQQATRQVILTLTKDGQLSFNNTPIPLKELEPRLKTFVGNQRSLVIIDADQQAEHGQVVTIMDQVRRLPNVRLAISADRSSKEP